MNWLDKLLVSGQISKEDYDRFKSNPNVTEKNWVLHVSMPTKEFTDRQLPTSTITYRTPKKEVEYKEPEMPRAIREVQTAFDNVRTSAEEVAGMVLAGDIKPKDAGRAFKDFVKEGFRSQAMDFVAPALDKSLKWASRKAKLPFDIGWSKGRIYSGGMQYSGGQEGINQLNEQMIYEQKEYRRRKEEEEEAKKPLMPRIK